MPFLFIGISLKEYTIPFNTYVINLEPEHSPNLLGGIGDWIRKNYVEISHIDGEWMRVLLLCDFYLLLNILYYLFAIWSLINNKQRKKSRHSDSNQGPTDNHGAHYSLSLYRAELCRDENNARFSTTLVRFPKKWKGILV